MTSKVDWRNCNRQSIMRIRGSQLILNALRLLLATRQTASLRKDEALDATTVNLLLRSYLAQHQYDQADRILARTSFVTSGSQTQVVRYYFYAGRLRAVQLNYSEAVEFLQGAIRRAPKDDIAPGFVQIVQPPNLSAYSALKLYRYTNTISSLSSSLASFPIEQCSGGRS